MEKTTQMTGASLITRMLYKILRPLAKILLTHGVSGQEAIEVLKLAYVDAAEQDFQIPGKRMSAQRISVLTGFNHMDVKRLRVDYRAEEASGELWDFNNRAAAVVSGWVNNAVYQKDGNPIDLPMEGEELSFTALVKECSGGSTPYAVLDELLRAGTVKQTLDGDICLRLKVYCPHESDEKMLELMGEQSSDLLKIYGHNINHPNDQSILQQVIKYQQIPPELVDSFKRLSEEKMMEALLELNAWLFKHSSPIKGSGVGAVESSEAEAERTVILGLYFYEGDASD